MERNNIRHSLNIIKLEYAARKLGNIREDLVFLGGCATGILITDVHAPDIRATIDVDCIVHVLSLRDYYELGNKLLGLGFKQDISDAVICRWLHDDLILDVMPTDEKILGFGNRWYEYAIQYSQPYELAPNLVIKVVNAPIFIATKLEAFKGRGNHDYLGSHDFEDIIAVIDGREELLNEISISDSEIKQYLKNSFSALLKEDMFLTSMPGHLNYGQLTKERTLRCMKRMTQIVEC